MMKRLMVLFLISVTFIITVVAQKEGLTATPTRIADSSEALFSTKGLSPSSAFLIYDLMFGKMSDKEIKEKYHFVEVNGTVEIPAVVWIEGEDVIPELANYGVRVKHKYGNLLTVQIPLNRFMELAQSNLCKNINVGEEVHPNLDKALAATGVNDIYNGIGLSHGLDGTGVVVGILDVGFEYGHPAFYDSTGTTLRIKRVWDQNAPAVTPPSEFNYYYGNELTTPNEILAAQHSTDGTWELHGTHVAGIAAGCGGNDTIGKTYRGVAPNADIVLVAYRENITCIFEGIDYIKSYAASINKPCVINMSFGSHIGPHDGTSDLCVLFDSTVASSPGVMLVQAAGNEGNKNIHISKTFSSTDSILRTLVAFDEPASGRGKIDVWGNPNESFEVGLFLYNSASHTIDTSSAFYSSTSGFYTFDFTEGNSEVSTTAHISCKDDNRNGRQNIYIELYNTNRLSNNQHIGIEIRCTSNNTVHAWTQGDNSTFINGGYSLATAGDVDYTICDQGTCHSVITVGSYFARNTSRFGQLSNFSSHGPTLDERTKPDITAPGESITAPFNRFAVQGQGGDNIIFQLLVTAITSFQNHTEYYGTLSGTSMATPFVAGVLALCLQENPHLTYSQAIDLLHNKAITDEHTGNISSAGNNLWGWGKVNAMGILDQISATAPPYTEDFEGETVLWRLANGSNTNRWVIGSATNHTSGGEKALYISDDNGITNTYTNTAASSVIAYCPLILEARDYAISFDWKSYGEGYYDFLRAALVPASVDINLDDWEPTTLPNSYIAIDGGSQLVIHVTWKTQVSTVTIPTAGEYNLVFFWHNNHIGGTNPGAAVDNIIIDTIASNINMPTVLTSSVSGITQSTASCGGNVTSDGGSTITERGVCWSTSQNPTIADAHTSDSTGTGTFTSSITGLTPGTTYHVRAYATNSVGTTYGEEVTFTTTSADTIVDGQPCPGTPTVTDIDGNVYNTVRLGDQCWMKEDMRATHFADGTPILVGYHTTSQTDPYYYSGGRVLYNWAAAIYRDSSINSNPHWVQGVCPAGWHLPSAVEWTVFTDHIRNQPEYTCGGDTSYIAKALASVTGWHYRNGECYPGDQSMTANNASGFGIIPGGYCNGDNTSSSFNLIGSTAYLWSSTEYSSNYGRTFSLTYDSEKVRLSYSSKRFGLSVRCLRNETSATQPTVTTNIVNNITSITAACGGNVTSSGGDAVLTRGVCWSTSQNPTISGNHTTDNSGTGLFTSKLTGLLPSTTYYVRAYATNSAGTAYGETVTFTTNVPAMPVIDEKSCPSSPTVTDFDGNIYSTVLLGNRCWMRENLRTTHFADGTAIPPGDSDTSYTNPYFYINPNIDVPVNGYLYNWSAAMHGAGSSNTLPSGVQGVCPTGWHLPSDAEWTLLTDYISSVPEHLCDGKIAKALASATEWSTSAYDCAVGNDQGINNTSGFSAVPAGSCYGSSFYGAGSSTSFWSSMEYNSYNVWYRNMYSSTSNFIRSNWGTKYYGYSVRCICDETGGTSDSSTDGQPCPNTPTVTDHEGNVYNTIKIGNQCWTKENLRTTTSPSTGRYLIPPAGTIGTYTGKQAHWFNNDSATYAPLNYGLLYNWNAAADTFVRIYGETSVSNSESNAALINFTGQRRGICPIGWHLPSEAEWRELTNYLSSQSAYTCEGSTHYIAKSLASVVGWYSGVTGICAIGNDPTMNNASGFEALPAGYHTGRCYGGPEFTNENLGAKFWTSTQYSSVLAYGLELGILYSFANLSHGFHKYVGMSVRCISNSTGGGVSASIPIVNTSAVSDIAATSATCGGNVTSDGSATITTRGVCWSTSQSPTVADAHTSDGAGTGTFTSSITGLTAGTTYYVRAYATNSSGTAYGVILTFTTDTTSSLADGLPCQGATTVTDIDNNTYNTVQIGNQCWMKENLRTTRYANGTSIALGSSTSATTAYRYYPNNNSSNVATYGYLYNWPAVMHGATSSSANPSGVQGICPTGWHVPSDVEWTQLTDYVSGQSQYVCDSNNIYIAKALASTVGWESSPYTCTAGNDPGANNATGFSALPAGGHGDSSNSFGFIAAFWSATEFGDNDAYRRDLNYYSPTVHGYDFYKYYGQSVRCVRNEAGYATHAPTATTDSVTSVEETSATLNGSIANPDSVPITAQGFEWKATDGGSYTQVSVTGSTMSYTLTGLTPATNYTYRAFVTTGFGTTYGSEVSFTTSSNSGTDGQPCPGTPTVTDIDGNVYNTVKIGNQCWMKENLRTTRYADSTAIEAGSSNSTTTPYRYTPYNYANNVAVYGYFYNWAAIMHKTASSNTNPSNVQGICPNGWHVPSNAEWMQLTDYVSSQSEYVCGNNSTRIAKALATNTGWRYYATPGGCQIGNNQSTNNATGFSAFPVDYYDDGSYGNSGYGAYFWSTSSYDEVSAYSLSLYHTTDFTELVSVSRSYGLSVRCVRGETSATLPTVITSAVSNITENTATCGGYVSTDGGSEVIEHGICWGSSTNPTVTSNHVAAGTGIGSFNVNISGLSTNTRYYVRAYAINIEGTAYGEEVTFTATSTSNGQDGQPCPGIPTLTDIDGNTYNTVQIGNQCWMRENLKTTHYADGTAIVEGSSNGIIPYRYNPGNSANNVATYGYLYNWAAVMHGAVSSNTNPSNVQGICPNGWHVPSDAEWTQLTDYVSSQSEYVCGNDNRNIVKALAATSWAYSNGNCLAGNNQSTNNATGFSILPAGSYGYGSYYFGGDAWFWSSTSELHAYYRSISESYAYVWRGSCDQYAGHSVRCVHALIGFTASLPTVTTDTVSGITATTATCSSEVTADGGTTVIERGVCWSTSPNPTVVDAHTTDGTGTGSFTSSITGLMPNTTYHVRAYATNSGGTAYGEILTFTTDTSASLSDGQPCLGTPIVTDIDGNTYNTVQIGNQCWMKENLRTTKYIDNTPIPAGTTSSYDEPYRYTPNNDEAYVVTYGYLYNWLAVMHGATSSSANPSGVQGICPTGWHVPSDAEWTQLTDYVSSRSEYVCNGGIHMIAKALAATTGWEYGSPICAVGNTPSNNNATGFSAFPAGAFSYYHHDFGDNAYFWSTTKYDDYAAYIRSLGCTFAYMNRYNRDIDLGFSVRCLRDENSAVDTSECFNDCHSGSCGEYGSAMYTAAQQLCHLGIVEGINGALQPDTNITRAELAKVALYSLYNGSSNVPSPLVSDFFPSIYPDLQVDTAYYYRPAKALLYLEYGDGVSPFDRDRSVFNPSGRIERCLVLKVLLETFNIAPATGGTTAFDDYGPSGYSSSKFWGYAQKAYDLGIVQTTHLRPNDYCTRGEAFLYLYRILTNSSINKPTPVNTEDPATSDFFIPTNLSPKVANAMHGVENGNFNYYEKDFFNIPGYMDLNFGVSYNSYLTEMPDDFYPVKPLGKAWTHTYDMYMNIVTDFYHNNSVLVFHMQNGSLLLYKNVNGTLTSMTEGNYYELTTSGNNQYILKSKDQISYTFERKSTSDGIYYLTQIKDRNNNAIDITYSSGESHYRISSVSTLGRTLNFYYTSGTDLLYYVNDPIDRNVYFYYTDEQLGSLKDAKNQTTYFTYGTSNAEKGLLTEITLPRGNMVFNGYQQRKLVSMRRVNNSNSYTHTTVNISPNYQNGSTSSTVTTNLNGSQSIITNYTMNGNNRITNVNDGLHNDMSYEYNISGKPDLVSKASDNKTSVQTTFNYNNKGLPTTVSVSAGGTTRTTNITYTSLNDVYQYTDAKGNTTTYNYTNGNLTSVVDALGNTTTIVNNSQGKPTQVTDPSGVVTNFTYNSYGNETRQSIPSISTYFDRTYDGVSRVTSAKTSCDCQTTSYTYDNNDNMVTATNALNQTTNYTYDANDNVTKITDAKGNATNLTYDDNDFLTSVSAQGASRSYTYNRDGSVATFTNPNGNTFNFSYNSSGELLNDGYASYDYNNKGQLISVTKDNKAITFSYDAFGRISSTAYNNKTISYTYDNNDNILTMTYPGNKTVTYTYDALNRMTSVKDWNNATTTYNYRDDGQLSYYQYPNGVRTTYGYDGGGRTVSQTTKRSNGSGTVVASYNYTWDEFGNHTQETFTEPYTEYPSIPNATTSYSYNNANRLTAAGNLTFGYDNNGNTTSRTGRTYGYDTKDNLTSVSGDFSASYTYDGLGNRRTATRNGVTRQYVLDLLGSMSNVLMETDGSGNALYYYVYGANGLVSRIDANNDTRYYVYDYRGSTVAMTDAMNAATVTHKYQYDDFGKVLQSEEADANPFRYVGQLGVMYEDDALFFMRARYYDPEIGRFLSEDPIWSTNLYPYADNNPIVYLDPDGNWSFNPDDMKDKEKKIKEDQKSVLRYIWKTTFPDVGKCEGWKKRFHMSKCVK